jgi:hypothetical protein
VVKIGAAVKKAVRKTSTVEAMSSTTKAYVCAGPQREDPPERYA